jgi:hypothetical protein
MIQFLAGLITGILIPLLIAGVAMAQGDNQEKNS